MQHCGKGVQVLYLITLHMKKLHIIKKRGRDYDSEKVFHKVSCGDGTFSCYYSYHGFYPDRIYQNSRS